MKIRVGVVGMGHFGYVHAKKYRDMEDVDLVGVCDISKENALKGGEEFDCRVFTDYKELIAWGMDAVSITTPATTHFEIARDCILAGIHVLVEKPICHTVELGHILNDLATINDIILQVGHIERFNPVVADARKIIELNSEFLTVSIIRNTGRSERGQDVSVILDLMIHDIDLALSFVESPISCVIPMNVSEDGNEAAAVIFFRNSSAVYMFAARNQPTSKRTIEIVNSPVLNMMTQHDCLHDELRSFLDCIQNGGPPVMSGGDAVYALEIARYIEKTKWSQNSTQSL